MEFRPINTGKKTDRELSFNPCFSGYGIQTVKPIARAFLRQSFNPCFSGYGIQTPWFPWRSPNDFQVSILVFLDMEFRHINRSRLKVDTRSFNPCFSGYGIQTYNSADPKGSLLQVSILVFLDMEFRHQQFPVFVWHIWVSILVFLDMEFRLGFILIQVPKKMSFNPCFSGYGIQTALFS